MKYFLLSNTIFVMASMTSLLYLSCFSYTLTLVIMYHILCKIYLVALQLSFYVMFFLSEITFLYLCIYLSMHLHFEVFHSHLSKSVSQYFLSFHKFNCSKILWPNALSDASRYDDGAQYFYSETISRWFPTKAEERFTCPEDGDCILPGTKLVFQSL